MSFAGHNTGEDEPYEPLGGLCLPFDVGVGTSQEWGPVPAGISQHQCGRDEVN